MTPGSFCCGYGQQETKEPSELLGSLWKMLKRPEILQRSSSPAHLPCCTQALCLARGFSSCISRAASSRMAECDTSETPSSASSTAAAALSSVRMGLVRGALMRHTPLRSYFWPRQGWKEVSTAHTLFGLGRAENPLNTWLRNASLPFIREIFAFLLS